MNYPATGANKVTSKQRRQFLAGSVAMASGVLIPALLPATVRAALTTTWGDGEVTVISDGHLSLPASFIAPQGIEVTELEALLAKYQLPTDRATPDCNITLWRTENRLVLFDVGAGPNFMPSAGQLLANMEELGIDPADITDVVFTHAHPDHLWGLIDDFDELAFPEAAYYMGRAEWDFWRADATLEKMPEARKSFVVGARNRFAYLEDRIQLFDAGDEIITGLEAIDTAGHTPGHMAFAVHIGSESLVLAGDAITNVALSFERPDWPSASDHDPEAGRKTRRRLLDRLAGDNSRLVGYHLPHPGFGRVLAEGDHFLFEADG
ncbi:MBL fold metallo-hydrolase [Chromatiales bacterium (ex Bugula neritina AB1)]|nr:MBL fold metallo-hydrolase [Chromatiales bacterium (ex Bugula neritina AB1)]